MNEKKLNVERILFMNQKTRTYKSNLWRPEKNILWDEYTNQQLLKYAQSAKDTPNTSITDSQGNSIIIKGTEAFQEYNKTPFNYNQLSSELTRRGAKNGWHFDEPIATKNTTNNSLIITITESRLKNTKEIRNKIDASLHDKLLQFFEGYKDTDKPKILSKLIERGLGDLLNRKLSGEKVVKYEAISERFI